MFFYQRQSWPKYIRQTLALVWNSALREKLNFKSFSLLWTKFSFFVEDWALESKSMKIWDLLNIFHFPNILSLKMFGNPWYKLYVTCLLLIFTIPFTCGERKIWYNIKKSQYIMTNIVWKTFVCILCLHLELQIWKTVIFWLNFINSFNTKFLT